MERWSAAGGLVRLVGALVLLATAVAAAVVLLVANGAVSPASVTSGWPPAEQWLQLVTRSAVVERLAVGGAALAVGLVSLMLLVLSVRRRTSTAAVHMLAADELGIVMVDSRGIETIGSQVALAVPGVVEAGVTVRGSGTTPVGVRLDIGVFPGSRVKEAGNEVRQRVREAIEQMVGLSVRDVSVAVHVVEPAELSRLLR